MPKNDCLIKSYRKKCKRKFFCFFLKINFGSHVKFFKKNEYFINALEKEMQIHRIINPI